jgi:hypothetical protein
MLPVLASKTLACWNLLPHFKCTNKNNLQTMATSTRRSLCQEVLNFTLKINTGSLPLQYVPKLPMHIISWNSPKHPTHLPCVCLVQFLYNSHTETWALVLKWQTAYAQIVLKHKEEAYSKQEIAPRKWKTDSTFSHVSLSLIVISVSARDFFI